MQKDTEEFLRNIRELRGKINDVKQQISTITKNDQLKTINGVSLLDVKNIGLLQYITNLAFLIHIKLDGKPLSEHSVVMNLVELRVVLEKIKPIEQKLKYQIDKLIRTAKFGENTETERATAKAAMIDPLSFKPNPDNFVAGTEESKNDVTDDSQGVYKAPKLAPVHFEEDKGNLSKREKERARALVRASKSRLMKDIITEYDDRPEEVAIIGASQESIAQLDDKDKQKIAERERYEEENFMRLVLPKKELKRMKASTVRELENEFENLNDFSNLANIHEDIRPSDVNVLARRKRRDKMANDEEMDEDADELTQQSRRKMENNKRHELFDGLLTDPNKIKKRRTKFETLKRRMKRQKR
ncbi:5276_t:CDS:2 [Paraglomus brasilianum]|uniref:5276_t:CDS:1 n=1 Tax=Paraglomus brasilianum TaxID=144538 RepID=A0A9N8WAG0_9GLOM|nr:5276_t:CDS:2 [Paraglomus brasilianum]